MTTALARTAGIGLEFGTLKNSGTKPPRAAGLSRNHVELCLLGDVPRSLHFHVGMEVVGLWDNKSASGVAVEEFNLKA